VSSLSLPGYGLSGSLAGAATALQSLPIATLHLPGNALEGSAAWSAAALPGLAWLSLAGSPVGEVGAALAGNAELRFLDLSGCGLAGAAPDVSGSPKLRTAGLEGNALSGDLGEAAEAFGGTGVFGGGGTLALWDNEMGVGEGAGGGRNCSK
jgi:hypothetical protein